MRYKILFVCLANEDRSPYAERYFWIQCSNKHIPVEVSSAGLIGLDIISKRSETGIQSVRELVEKQDIIFVMEEDIGKELVRDYKANPKKIVNLNVPDLPNPDRIREEIRTALESYIDEKKLEEIVQASR